jgi:hypothetical protein
MVPTTTASSTVLDQLDAVVAQLREIHDARGWGVREMGRMLGIHHGHIVRWRDRASTTTTLPTLDAYARELGHTLRLQLVEDRPGERPRPWRERMPHGEDPLDTHAMGAVWRLQQQLHHLRFATGRSTGSLAAVLGLRPFDCWQLENSPCAADAALINVMLYARFFSCRIVFQLEPLAPERRA